MSDVLERSKLSGRLPYLGGQTCYQNLDNFAFEEMVLLVAKPSAMLLYLTCQASGFIRIREHAAVG